MKKFTSSAFLLMCCCCCGLAGTAAAQQPQATVDVSVGGSVATNPFLYVDSETAAAANLEIRPLILWEDEVGRTSIEGNLRVAQYTNRYGNDFSGRIGVSSERQLDEKTRFRISSVFQSARSAIQDDFFALGQGPIDPGASPVPEIPPVDTSIAGISARTHSAGASAGLTRTIDEVSSIDLGVSLNAAFVDDNAGFDYRNLSGQIGYQRKLSERTTITASVDGGFVDYLGRSTGDSTIISPQIGIRQQLNSRLSLVAGVGISYVNTDVGAGNNSGRVTFSGNAGFCDRGLNRTLCVTASRSAQPTALGGVSSVTAIAANYDVTLSRNDRISVAARYGRTDQNGNNGLPGGLRITDIVGASATYNHRISDRMSLTVTPGFTKIYGDAQSHRDANYSIMVGFTIRFGTLR